MIPISRPVNTRSLLLQISNPINQALPPLAPLPHITLPDQAEIVNFPLESELPIENAALAFPVESVDLSLPGPVEVAGVITVILAKLGLKFGSRHFASRNEFNENRQVQSHPITEIPENTSYSISPSETIFNRTESSRVNMEATPLNADSFSSNESPSRTPRENEQAFGLGGFGYFSETHRREMIPIPNAPENSGVARERAIANGDHFTINRNDGVLNTHAPALEDPRNAVIDTEANALNIDHSADLITEMAPVVDTSNAVYEQVMSHPLHDSDPELDPKLWHNLGLKLTPLGLQYCWDQHRVTAAINVGTGTLGHEAGNLIPQLKLEVSITPCLHAFPIPWKNGFSPYHAAEFKAYNLTYRIEHNSDPNKHFFFHHKVDYDFGSSLFNPSAHILQQRDSTNAFFGISLAKKGDCFFFSTKKSLNFMIGKKSNAYLQSLEFNSSQDLNSSKSVDFEDTVILDKHVLNKINSMLNTLFHLNKENASAFAKGLKTIEENSKLLKQVTESSIEVDKNITSLSEKTKKICTLQKKGMDTLEIFRSSQQKSITNLQKQLDNCCSELGACEVAKGTDAPQKSYENPDFISEIQENFADDAVLGAKALILGAFYAFLKNKVYYILIIFSTGGLFYLLIKKRISSSERKIEDHNTLIFWSFIGIPLRPFFITSLLWFWFFCAYQYLTQSPSLGLPDLRKSWMEKAIHQIANFPLISQNLQIIEKNISTLFLCFMVYSYSKLFYYVILGRYSPWSLAQAILLNFAFYQVTQNQIKKLRVDNEQAEGILDFFDGTQKKSIPVVSKGVLEVVSEKQEARCFYEGDILFFY